MPSLLAGVGQLSQLAKLWYEEPCLRVCQVSIMLLCARSLSLHGDMFIRAAMTLDDQSQWQIRDFITGLQEPGRNVTADVIGQLLSTPRGDALHATTKGKMVKVSHSRHRAFGPELIPVYRQSACR